MSDKHFAFEYLCDFQKVLDEQEEQAEIKRRAIYESRILPKGKTCFDCTHFSQCRKIHISSANQVCIYAPHKFPPKRYKHLYNEPKLKEGR